MYLSKLLSSFQGQLPKNGIFGMWELSAASVGMTLVLVRPPCRSIPAPAISRTIVLEPKWLPEFSRRPEMRRVIKRVKSATDKPPKKLYQGPTLKVYGDLRHLTHAVGNGGQKDGGSGLAHKTH